MKTMGENVSLRALADFAGRAMGALGIIRGLREAAGGGDRESGLAEDRGRETRGRRKRTGRAIPRPRPTPSGT